MKQGIVNKAFSTFISITLVAAFALPATALAAQPEVQVENHTTGMQTVSKLSIDGVEAPEAGKPLDDKATVSTTEGVTWDIPVLWISNNLQLATEAVEGNSYLPALAFFVPQDYAVEGDSFTILLSDSLSKLFNNENAVSIFDARTGITYILPLSLKDYFTPTANAINIGANAATSQEEPEIIEGLGDGDDCAALNLVEVFCAQTARDALTDEDLEYLINLIIHTLEPQAVNLLMDSFPSFKAAANQGQIGKEIGLYIYYKTGDKDGKSEHESTSDALAYVSGDTVDKNGTLKYCYLIGIDVDDLLIKTDDDPVRNVRTGKFTLDRAGEGSITFNNTIVHEMFHAFMDDYNRTGMLGSKNVADGYTPNGKFANKAQRELYDALHFPHWFIEGSASAVENVYQFRYDAFKMLRAAQDNSTIFENTYSKPTLLYNYVHAKSNNKDLYYELEYASYGNVDTSRSRYVSGYLAVLYLAQLAAQKSPSIGSAVNDQGVVSSEKLRLGFDSILNRLHSGETLDAVIKDISSINGAAALYADTNDFEKKFIKGGIVDTPEGQYYFGDNTSMDFTLAFLKYMLSLENTPGRNYKPNGSILFDFDQDFNIPLNEAKNDTSDFLSIAYTNEYVESTVPASVAFAGGGKSEPPSTPDLTNQSIAAKADAELPVAAKAASEPHSMGLAEDVPSPVDEPVAEPQNEPANEPATAPVNVPAETSDTATSLEPALQIG